MATKPDKGDRSFIGGALSGRPHFVGDSAIVPPVSTRIPMPQGAAPPKAEKPEPKKK